MVEIQMSRKAAAYKIHMDIMAAGEVAAEAFSTFCKLLKTMRDDKLWQELEYSSFEAYCENAVGLKHSQAYAYIKAYEDFGDENSTRVEKLGIKKLKLLGTVPKDSREQFMNEHNLEEMTTRQIEAAVREYKEKLKAKEAELAKKQEALEKANQYADEHMMRARQAEFEIQKKTQTIEDLKKEVSFTKQQLDQAKRNADPQKIQELGEIIKEKQQEIENLRKQLKDKPIEVPAVKIVEKVPEKSKYEVINRTYGTLLAAKLISKSDIEICREADFTRKNSIIEFLENLRDAIPEYLNILNEEVQQHKCEDCRFCDWEDLKEEDEAAGMIYCTLNEDKQLWYNNRACENFEEL